MYLHAGGPIENRAATPVSPLDHAPQRFLLEWSILTGQHPQLQAAKPLESRAATVQTPEENALLTMSVGQNLIAYLTQPRAAR